MSRVIIHLEWTQVCGKTEITDMTKKSDCLFFVFYSQSFVFQICQQCICVKRRIRISHRYINKKFRPGALFNGKRGGF